MRIIRRLIAIGVVILWATLTPKVAFASGVERLAVQENGIVGQLHFMPDARDKTTVILLNGSDGGIPSARDADDLAEAGYTVLALAYFQNWQGQPSGLPATLNEIPLEYFFKAIDWLKRQPQVDENRVVMMGQSRGGELALLLASIRSDIAGVVAFSPSSRIWNGIPPAAMPASALRAAWTLDGKPVSYQLSVADNSVPMREWFERVPPVEAARIRVERIKGPLLLVSSRADKIWPAASYADEIAKRLAERGSVYSVQNLQFDDASHLLMGTGPGITKFDIPGTTRSVDFGGTTEGNTRARSEAWAASKRFLSAI